MKIGLIQMKVGEDKEENITKAESFAKELSQEGANIIILPEMFNCPYEMDKFSDYAEPIPGETTERMSELAQKLNVYLIGGSIPERENGEMYNSSPIFDPQGSLIARHRKINLFDVNIPGKVVFKESEHFAPGKDPTVATIKNTKVGVAICFDLRFPELSKRMAEQGSKLLIYPGAFNTTTGPAHWKTLIRTRAIDNQLFVAACSPARNPESSYQAYGHSMIVDPWGTPLQEMGEEEGFFTQNLDLSRVKEVRKRLPIIEN